jgi:hypothetical protein
MNNIPPELGPRTWSLINAQREWAADPGLGYGWACDQAPIPTVGDIAAAITPMLEFIGKMRAPQDDRLRNRAQIGKVPGDPDPAVPNQGSLISLLPGSSWQYLHPGRAQLPAAIAEDDATATRGACRTSGRAPGYFMSLLGIEQARSPTPRR